MYEPNVKGAGRCTYEELRALYSVRSKSFKVRTESQLKDPFSYKLG